MLKQLTAYWQTISDIGCLFGRTKVNI